MLTLGSGDGSKEAGSLSLGKNCKVELAGVNGTAAAEVEKWAWDDGHTNMEQAGKGNPFFLLQACSSLL